MKKVSGLLLVLAMIFGLRIWGPVEHTAVAQANQAGRDAGPWNKFAFKGNGTCGGTACHDARNPNKITRSEFTIWNERDKHARTYDERLYNDQSKKIERNLHQPGTDWHNAHPEKDTLCLKCHALKTDNPLQNPAVVRTGFSCENCHGPAEKWLGEHYLEGWKQKSAEDKEKLGMMNLKVGSLANRAQVCVDCHVGNAALGMEVNHDLIAAGHPRLFFEFGGYHAKYPKHWNEKAEKEQAPDLEARLWLIGQLASAEAALEMTAYRADEKSNRPWPEFAEYDCFGCHHDLAVPSWRQSRGYAGRRAGDLPWGTWYLSQTPQLVNGFEAPFMQLQKEMGKSYPARPAVQQQAASLVKQVREGLVKAKDVKFTPDSLRNTLTQLDQQLNARTAPNWDAADQLFNRFVALYYALEDLDAGKADPHFLETIKTMQKELAMPKGYASPRNFQPKNVGQ
jgi:hypothetical protein